MFDSITPHQDLQDLMQYGYCIHGCHEFGNEILDDMMGRDRLYHGVFHLAQMWSIHKKLLPIIAPRFETEEWNYGSVSSEILQINNHIALFILCHDWVYDATRNDNEVKSAERWEKLTKSAGCNPCQKVVDTQWVYDAIIATADHLADRPIEADADRLREYALGLDLASLAAPWDQFKLNNALIRLEYRHVSDEAWKAGNGAFLKKLLAAPAIYRDPTLQELFEERARENIQRHLS